MSYQVTEATNVHSAKMDQMSTLEILSLMQQEDYQVHQCMEKNLNHIAEAVDLIVDKWKLGARIFVVGAGTSGRIGILDAVELGPTFSVPDNRWIGLIAGGKGAMWDPLEQFEDSQTDVVEELKSHSFQEKDVLIAISASGSTPFATTALRYANELKASTISISCNYKTVASTLSDIAIELIVGPEVIRGSTRLKAGTAQKLALNMISTTTMVRLGKVYHNEMINMQLLNNKLIKRAEEMLVQLANISYEQAKLLMNETNNDLKTAMFLAQTGSGINEAISYLEKTNGHLNKAITLYTKR